MRRSLRPTVTLIIGATPDALSNHPDHAVAAQLLPGQPEHQRVDLGLGERQRTVPRRPAEAHLV